jgi:hypothetical protein
MWSTLYPELPTPDNDSVFQYLLHSLGTMSKDDTAKGDLGDKAVAWAFCRIARSGKSIGEAFNLPNRVLHKC